MAAIINASNSSGLTFTSDNSGVLQFQQNGVALPALSVAPAFSAYAGATQNITSSTFTKVQINTEIFDTNSCYDSTTNYRFTPTVAGYYHVGGVIRISQTAGATDSIIALYKNGTIYQRGQEFNATVSGNNQLVGNWLIFLNGSTDYIELYGYMSQPSASFNFGSASTTSLFYAFLARGA